MGLIGCPETSVNNYQSTPCVIQKSEDLIYTAAEAWNHAKLILKALDVHASLNMRMTFGFHKNIQLLDHVRNQPLFRKTSSLTVLFFTLLIQSSRPLVSISSYRVIEIQSVCNDTRIYKHHTKAPFFGQWKCPHLQNKLLQYRYEPK